MEMIQVSLGEQSYTVFVGAGLLDGAARLLPPGDWQRAVIVTDANVGPLYRDRLLRSLSEASLKVRMIEVEPGERSKSMEKAIELLDYFLESELTRFDMVSALGGGVVGDLAGFAASIYKRGVKVLQVPTTLMAQVDSAIGGKTGVDLEAGKNLVGAFHQPIAVVADVGTLMTLPAREFVSGLAEVAKYEFLRPGAWSPGTVETIERLLERDRAALEMVIAACARVKADFVMADERDTGERASLNYGHTLGHALEVVTGYSGVYTHGEAVSIGMVYAAVVGEETSVSPKGLSDRHRTLLRALGLPVRPADPPPAFDQLLGTIVHDKKSAGDIAMVLLQEEGRPVLRCSLDAGILERCYERLLKGD
jgi:3-dehydroquinate synthase